MANAVVRPAASVSTDLSDTVLNPTVQGTPAGSGNRKIVHITLVCENVDVTAASIYTALDTQYAVVGGEKDLMARGAYIFNIGP